MSSATPLRDKVQPTPNTDAFRHYIDPRPMVIHSGPMDTDLPETQRKAGEAVQDAEKGRTVQGMSKAFEAANTILNKDDRFNPSPAKEMAKEGIREIHHPDTANQGIAKIADASQLAQRETIVVAQEGEEGRARLRDEWQDRRREVEEKPITQTLKDQWDHMAEAAQRDKERFLRNINTNVPASRPADIATKPDDSGPYRVPSPGHFERLDPRRSSSESFAERAGEKWGAAKENIKEDLGAAKENIKQDVRQGAERAKESFTSAENRVEGAWEQGKQRVEGAWQEGKERTGHLLERGKEGVTTIRDDIASVVEKGRDAVAETAHVLRDKTVHGLETIRDTAEGTLEKAKETASEVVDKAKEGVQRVIHPGSATDNVSPAIREAAKRSAEQTIQNAPASRVEHDADGYWKPRDLLSENLARSPYRKDKDTVAPPLQTGGSGETGYAKTRTTVEGVPTESAAVISGGPSYRTYGDVAQPQQQEEQPGLLERAKETVQDAKETVKNKVNEKVVGVVKDVVKDKVKDTVNDKIEGAKDTVKSAAGAVSDVVTSSAPSSPVAYTYAHEPATGGFLSRFFGLITEGARELGGVVAVGPLDVHDVTMRQEETSFDVGSTTGGSKLSTDIKSGLKSAGNAVADTASNASSKIFERRDSSDLRYDSAMTDRSLPVPSKTSLGPISVGPLGTEPVSSDDQVEVSRSSGKGVVGMINEGIRDLGGAAISLGPVDFHPVDRDEREAASTGSSRRLFR